MKKLFLLSFIAIFIFACNNDSTNESNSKDNNTEEQTSENSASKSFVKYPFESGIIEFKSEMMGMNFIMTLYIKDYGKQQCIASETEMMGKKINTRAFEKDGYLYTLLMEQKTGGKMKITDEDGFGKKNPFAFKEEFLEEVNGKKDGTEEVLGKKCQIYSFIEDGATNKIWVWDNLIIKLEAEQGGMKMLTEVTKIEETNNLPDGIFEVPADFKITVEEDMQEAAEDFIDEKAKG